MSDVADHVLDCKGMACPLPIIKTAKEIKTLDVGQVLELLATDPGVEPDMTAWTRRTKHELLKIEKTDNPVIQLVMEIIQRDSQMHHRVQQWIADSLTVKAVSLSPEELGEVWEMIEQHIAIEKKTQVLASASLEAAKGSKGMLLQAYLLEYLLEDEKKHDLMLQRLEEIKKGMYPYA